MRSPPRGTAPWWRGYDAVGNMVEKTKRRGKVTTNTYNDRNELTNITHADQSHVSYVQAQHYLPNDKGDSTFTLGGYYTNDLVRYQGGWKIVRCRLEVTWSTGNRHIFELARQRVARGEEGQRRH